MNNFIIALLVIYALIFVATPKGLPKWFMVGVCLIFVSTVVILNIFAWQDQQNTILRVWILVNSCALWYSYGNLARMIEYETKEQLVRGILKLIFIVPCFVQTYICCKIML